MTTRTASIVLALSLIGCTTPTVVVPSPTPTASPAATATATAAGSPTASPRAIRPFTGVLPTALPDPTTIAPDRGRVAYLNAARQLVVQDVAGQPRVVASPQDGFELRLHPHGLRGDTLVYAESRTQGQRTDTRVRRADLAANTIATLDDHSGPFLGFGDTWHPLPPVTNGRDVAWIRVDDERSPFGVHIVLSRGGGAATPLHSGTSAAWVDLHDDGRVLMSILIGAGQVAELVLWRDGASTPLGTRPSGEGGPATFVGDKAFWQRGTGIVARSEGGELIDPSRQVRRVDFAGCGTSGSAGRYLLIHCGTGAEAVLLDPETGERFALPGLGHVAGSRALAWREDTQWWIGTIAQ